MEHYDVTRKKNGPYKDVKKVSNCHNKRQTTPKDGFSDQKGINNLSLRKFLKK